MSRIHAYSILRASGAGVVQRLAQLLSSLITLPVALHTLGVAGFGIWGAATSLAWLSGLLTLGFGSALITLIPRHLALGQTAQIRGYVTASLHGGATLAVLLLLGGLAAIRLTGRPVPHGPFLVASVSLILNIPLSVSFELWLALQKSHIAAFWGTVQTALSLGLRQQMAPDAAMKMERPTEAAKMKAVRKLWPRAPTLLKPECAFGSGNNWTQGNLTTLPGRDCAFRYRNGYTGTNHELMTCCSF